EEKVHDIIAAEREAAKPFDQAELDASAPVIAPINQLRANNPRGDVEVEFKIVRFPQVAKGLSQSRRPIPRANVRAQHRHVIGEEALFQRADDGARTDGLDDLAKAAAL